MKSFAITRTDTPPTIDGHIDEAAWSEATVVTDFHQNEPLYREAATENTVVRILYDDDYLYIGAALNDSEPDKIVANHFATDLLFFAAVAWIVQRLKQFIQSRLLPSLQPVYANNEARLM